MSEPDDAGSPNLMDEDEFDPLSDFEQAVMDQSLNAGSSRKVMPEDDLSSITKADGHVNIEDELDKIEETRAGALSKSAPPALYTHCLRIYSHMLNAVQIDDEGKPIYVGFLTRAVVDELRISTPTYSHAIRALKTMGCIVSLKRGGGMTPSQWRLVRRPTLELYTSNGVGTLLDNAKNQRNDGEVRYRTLRDEHDRLVRRVARQDEEISKMKDMIARIVQNVYGNDSAKVVGTTVNNDDEGMSLMDIVERETSDD